MTKKISIAVAAAFALASAGALAQDKKGEPMKDSAKKSAPAKASAGKPRPSFFVTSKGSGKGGDLGGLKGADAHCQALAKAAGAGSKTWAAYLSTQGPGAVNAKDRIGKGPWYNAKGQLIAKDVASLHNEAVPIDAKTALDEKGQP